MPLAGIIRGDDQISGLMKKAGAVAVDIYISILLRDLTVFGSCTWTAPMIALYAASLRRAFWMLRFDELAYVFFQIANGVYGKIYGNLSYNFITDCIEKYMSGERALALEQHNKQKESQAIENLSQMPPEVLQIWKDHNESAEEKRISDFIEASKQKKPPRSVLESYEAFVENLADRIQGFDDEELQNLSDGFGRLSVHGEVQHPEALEVVKNEIKRRAAK